MRNPFRFPTNLPTYFTARLDAGRIVKDDEESCIHHCIASRLSNPQGADTNQSRVREGL